MNSFIFDPVIYTTPERKTFKYFELKQILFEQLKINSIEKIELCKQVESNCKKDFIAVEGGSYARFDNRFEVNAYWSVFEAELNSTAVIIIQIDANWDYVKFIRIIIISEI